MRGTCRMIRSGCTSSMMSIGMARTGDAGCVLIVGGIGPANSMWFSSKAIRPCLSAGQRAAMCFEVGHVHGWESAGLMNLSRVVVFLVDFVHIVDDVGLYSLSMYDRLDDLMNVVMHMFASDNGSFLM